METMTGRVAVVTGAASGIGKALALGFAGEGANVVLADIEEEPLRAAEAEIAGHGVEALGVITDVTDADSVGALAQATIDRFGAVHMVCNNAGVGGGGLIRNQQLVDWKWVVDVCLWGVIHGVHHFLPHLIEAEESHIMSTASVAGLMSVPGLGPYNAAKYGVVAIPRSATGPKSCAASGDPGRKAKHRRKLPTPAAATPISLRPWNGAWTHPRWLPR